jgi:hypothetical protein
MKFEEWWATLTTSEQKLIGRTNAKFVWMEACEACAKLCEKNANDFSEGDWDPACISCADHIRARGNK